MDVNIKKEKVKLNEHFQVKNVFQKRAIATVEQINEDTREVQVAFASEASYERWDGTEIVKVDGIDLTRLNNNAPLLFNHDVNLHIGSVKKAWVDADKVARAIVKFGVNPLANEKYLDFKNGDLTKISWMYCPTEIVWVGEDNYFVTKSEGYEISFVTIPADDSVGFARSLAFNKESAEDLKTIDLNDKKQEKSIEIVDDKKEKFDNDNQSKLNNNINKKGAKSMDYKQLIELFPQFKEKAAEFLMDGKTADEFATYVKEQTRSASIVSSSQKTEEKQEFDVARLIKSIVTKTKSYEKEVSDKYATQYKNGVEDNKFYIPLNAFKKQYESGVAANGGNLVQTNLVGLVDPLRANSVVAAAGATYLNGLIGQVQLPKMATGAEPTYIDNESQDAVSANATFSLIDLTKKTLSDHFVVTRDMILNSSYDIQSIGMNEALVKIAKKMDKDILFGSTPIVGVANTSGIGAAATFGAPTYANILGLKAGVESLDAVVNKFTYITNPTIATKLKTTARSGSNNGFIAEQGMIDGDMLLSTSACPSGTILAGDFSQVVIGNWGVVELIVDPYSLSKRGGVQFTVLVDYGVAVKHAQSFVKATGVA